MTLPKTNLTCIEKGCFIAGAEQINELEARRSALSHNVPLLNGSARIGGANMSAEIEYHVRVVGSKRLKLLKNLDKDTIKVYC